MSGSRVAPLTVLPADGAPPPAPGQLVHLKASDAAGVATIGAASLLTVIGIWLSVLPGVVSWAIGQLLFALALVQWFAILHECLTGCAEIPQRAAARGDGWPVMGGWVLGWLVIWRAAILPARD